MALEVAQEEATEEEGTRKEKEGTGKEKEDSRCQTTM